MRPRSDRWHPNGELAGSQEVIFPVLVARRSVTARGRMARLPVWDDGELYGGVDVDGGVLVVVRVVSLSDLRPGVNA